ncbi:MAG: hypothetical protein QOH31_5313 [Verrucomicrobiota bacterium]
MRLGIFAKTFSGSTLADVLRSVSRAGYHSVQLNLSSAGLPSMPDALNEEDVRQIVDAIKTTQIRIEALSGTFNMAHPDSSERKNGLRRFNEVCRIANRIQAPVVTVCTGTRDVTDMWKEHPENCSAGAWKDLCDTMEGALRAAEENDVLLGVEPEHGNVTSNAPKARKLLDTFRTGRLRIVLDPANLVGGERDGSEVLTEAFDLLGTDVILAHGKDRGLDGLVTAPGSGVVPWDFFVQLLRHNRFSGALIVHGVAEKEATRARAFFEEVIFS